jgi:hypothetical protein
VGEAERAHFIPQSARAQRQGEERTALARCAEASERLWSLETLHASNAAPAQRNVPEVRGRRQCHTQRHRDSRTEECGFKRRGDAPRCSGRLSPPCPGRSSSRGKARAKTALAASLVAGARAETRRTRARASVLRAESRHAAAQARHRRCPHTTAQAASLAAAGCASLTLLATRAHRCERWSASLRGGRAGSRSVYAGITERDARALHAFGPRRISWWLCVALAAESRR